MASLAIDLRLLLSLLLAIALAVACWRAAGRCSADRTRRTLDTLLLWHVAMYVITGVLGLVGLLTPDALLIGTLLAIGGLAYAGRSTAALPPPSANNVIAAAVVLGTLAAMFWSFRLLPPRLSDPLIYHLPVAVEWLQHGRLFTVDLPFHNPANTFSPLGGSVIMTWWMGLGGSDFLVRGVQGPAVLLLACAVAATVRDATRESHHRLCRYLPALAAVAIALGRPIFSQATDAKDDVLAAAFFATAMFGLLDRSPLRFALGLGLMLAMKYTTLLAMPLLLLGWPWWRARHLPPRGWKPLLMAFAIITLLAGPWYLRNLVVYGNPIFPMALPGLPGFLRTTRAEGLRSISGVTYSVVTSFYGLTWPLMIALLLGWSAAVVKGARDRGPLWRMSTLGVPICVLAYVFASPYAESRFLLPALAVSIAACCTWWPAAVLVCVAAVASALQPQLLAQVALPIVCCAALAGGVVLAMTQLSGRLNAVSGAVMMLMLGGWTFVYGGWVLNSYAVSAVAAWRENYWGIADAWAYLAQHVPADARVGYTQITRRYPLAGTGPWRVVRYVPTSEIVHVADLPDLGAAFPGERIATVYLHAIRARASRDTWRANLAGVDVYVIGLRDPDTLNLDPPPEFAWALQELELLMENPDAAVFRVK